MMNALVVFVLKMVRKKVLETPNEWDDHLVPLIDWIIDRIEVDGAKIIAKKVGEMYDDYQVDPSRR